MKKVELVPHGWPCPLKECPMGLFIWDNAGPGIIGFKCIKEDSPVIKYEVYDLITGEVFWGDTESEPARGEIIVSPCILEGEIQQE